MQTLKSYAIIAIAFILISILVNLLFSKNIKRGIKLIIGVFTLCAAVGLVLGVHTMWLYVCVAALVTGPVYAFVFPSKKEEETEKAQIILEHSKGKILYNNPYTGFMAYGGAGSGKTVSCGKPLLSEFMRNQFAIFGYDAKENDYTKTAGWLKNHLDYPYPIYNVDYADLSRSYRFNPISKKLITDEAEIPEIAEIIYKTLAKKAALSEWDDKALGLFKAIAYYVYHYNPNCFTIPHILNMLTQNDAKVLLELIKNEPVCRTYAKSLIDSKGSEVTMSSILSTLSGVISNLSANKKWCYILTGDDFEFNLTDPKDPKAFFITNTFKFRGQISPLISLLFVMAMKGIEYGNKVPMVAFLDEGTTFKIEDLEAYPSELREYLLAMVIITQSPAKIEKLYGKLDRSSLEANLQNHFYFRTKDHVALDIFTNFFSKKEEVKKSVTTRDGKDGRSVTRSTQDKKRYEKDFFINLKAGECVGSATDSNRGEFHVRLKPYEGGKLNENPIVRKVTQEDIDNQYQKIIDDITY